MKSLINVKESACRADQVLLPDRYQQPFIDAYQALTGIEVPEKQGRRMSVRSNGVLFRWLRGRDIPQIVERSAVADPSSYTIGLTGSEWCCEYSAARAETPLIWGSMSEKCIGRVCVIASTESDTELLKKELAFGSEPVQVVSAYPNLIRSLRLQSKCNLTTAVAVSGGVEGIADTLSMPAVDLVSGGETIKINGFVEVKTLLNAYPELVCVPSG